MSRIQNRDARRAQIIDALIAVMAKRGYDGASIGDIAERAGLTPGLVHYHFENKLEILVEAVGTIAAAHAARLSRALAGAADPAAELQRWIEAHLGLGEHASPATVACWVLVTGEALREKRVRTAVARVIHALVAQANDIIARGNAAGLFACADPAAAAAALVATIHGYFVVAATARAAIPAGSAAITTLRMATGLVGAHTWRID